MSAPLPLACAAACEDEKELEQETTQSDFNALPDELQIAVLHMISAFSLRSASLVSLRWHGPLAQHVQLATGCIQEAMRRALLVTKLIHLRIRLMSQPVANILAGGNVTPHGFPRFEHRAALRAAHARPLDSDFQPGGVPFDIQSFDDFPLLLADTREAEGPTRDAHIALLRHAMESSGQVIPSGFPRRYRGGILRAYYLMGFLGRDALARVSLRSRAEMEEGIFYIDERLFPLREYVETIELVWEVRLEWQTE